MNLLWILNVVSFLKCNLCNLKFITSDMLLNKTYLWSYCVYINLYHKLDLTECTYVYITTKTF